MEVSEYRTLCEAFLLLASKYPPTAKAAKSLSSRARRLAKAWTPHCVALPSIFTCQTSAFHLSALPTAIAGLNLLWCVWETEEATTLRAPTYRLQLLTISHEQARNVLRYLQIYSFKSCRSLVIVLREGSSLRNQLPVICLHCYLLRIVLAQYWH